MQLNQDKTIPELFKVRNKEGKQIVVYSSDERAGVQCASAMVDRGYENTCLLTGGWEQFKNDFATLIE